jgi:hypothetical protein
MKTPCDASRRLYGNAELCPQLHWSDTDNRYYCGLMTIEGALGADYRKELYAGAGCCCGLNSWRQDVKKRTRGMMEYRFPKIPSMFQAFLKAYGKEPFIGSDTTALLLNSFRGELKVLDYSEDEIISIMKGVSYHISSNKTSMFKEFMS